MSEKLTFETIKKHAATLARVLKILRKSLPDIESDQLWQAIETRWSEADLEKAVKAFKKSGSIATFRKLSSPTQHAESNGTFVIDGNRWGTFRAWARILGIDARTISRHVTSAAHASRWAKNASGLGCKYYAEPDVRRVCSHLLVKDKAGPDGTFEANGKRWGSVRIWQDILRIGIITISIRLKNTNCVSRRAKDRGGHATDFYSEEDVRKVCADILVDVPRSDSDGTLVFNKRKWGSVAAWCRILGISETALSERCQVAEVSSMKAKNCSGQLIDFYAEEDVRMACADLIERKRKSTGDHAGLDGTYVADGERWGSLGAWQKILGPARDTLLRRLDAAGCHSCKARSGRGHVVDFYTESDVRTACADLVREK